MSIRRLLLRDFVIVKSLELDLNKGFTALTGETGAGKSILIDAIQIALGERASTQVIREGASKADIAVEFDCTDLVATWLAEAGFALEESLLVRRTIDTEGRSRAWINGSAATATQLRELAEYLVDIHGQHAWAMLTRSDAVRSLLDAYGQIDTRPLQMAWQHWRIKREQLDLAKNSAEQQSQAREQLQWQIAEVEKLAPQAGEWQSISAEHVRLSSAQNLIDSTTQALVFLNGGDSDHPQHALTLIQQALNKIEALATIEPAFQTISEELRSSLVQIEDASHSLHSYLHKLDLDPARLAQLDERMVDWLSLARRYKCSPETLAELLTQWQDKLAGLNALSDIAALEKQEAAAYAALGETAAQVSKLRQIAAPDLSLAITTAMQELGMQGGQFQVSLQPHSTPTAHGLESAEFLVSGHAGVAPKPVGKIASGGELSRIALAIAVTTSKLGSAPTLIFDEVDAGIGGTTGHSVGRLLRQLGLDRQVLAVTHLPQVASCADHHGVIIKYHDADTAPERSGAPISQIHMVEGESRVREIARMLGDSSQNTAALKHAAALLEQA